MTQFVKGSGGVGGGTIASLLGVFDSPKEELKAIGDPYCLNPPDSKRGPDQPDSLGFHYSDATSRYLGPFVMAPINTRAVRRSNALLGYRYGNSQLPPAVCRHWLLRLMVQTEMFAPCTTAMLKYTSHVVGSCAANQCSTVAFQ